MSKSKIYHLKSNLTSKHNHKKSIKILDLPAKAMGKPLPFPETKVSNHALTNANNRVSQQRADRSVTV